MKNYCAALLSLVSSVLLCALNSPLRAQQTATITGVVKSASGEPVEGAFVRIRNLESGIGFMVVSQAQGRYTSPNLLPGKYMVEGIGGEYQSEPVGPVEVSGARPTAADVALSSARKATPPRKRLTQADFAAVMPEGPAKQVILTKCVNCHTLEGVDTRTLARPPASRKEWEEVLGVHQYYTGNRPDHLSNDEMKLVLDYMTENDSREGHPIKLPSEKEDRTDVNRHLPRTLLKGIEARYVAVDFVLEQNTRPHDISVDSQGVAWIGAHSEESGGIGVVGRIDPKTLSYTEIVPPPGKFSSNYQYLSGSAIDPQGMIWDSDNGHNARLVSYNPKTGQFKTYDVPSPPRLKDLSITGSANMNTLAFQDGFVWGSGLLSDQIYRLDPASGGVITYPTPPGLAPYGMAFDKNKMLWYAAEFGDQIVKLDPATGKQTFYKVLTPHADLRHIQTDGEGNVWAAAQESDKLIKVDARTGEVTEYEPPTKLSGITTVDVDRKNNLIWVGEDQMDKLARFDPRTKTFVEFPLPTPGIGVKRIKVDPSNPNRVWWCSQGATPGSASQYVSFNTMASGPIKGTPKVASSSRAGYIEVIEGRK